MQIRLIHCAGNFPFGARDLPPYSSQNQNHHDLAKEFDAAKQMRFEHQKKHKHLKIFT